MPSPWTLARFLNLQVHAMWNVKFMCGSSRGFVRNAVARRALGVMQQWHTAHLG
jgi:hypothetical protein